jgi:hypothetical protein
MNSELHELAENPAVASAELPVDIEEDELAHRFERFGSSHFLAIVAGRLFSEPAVVRSWVDDRDQLGHVEAEGFAELACEFLIDFLATKEECDKGLFAGSS